MTSGTPAHVMRFLLVWDQTRPRNGVMDESPAGNWVAFGDYDRLAHRIEQLEAALRHIGDRAHDLSTGPAVPDGYWELRELAYDAALSGVSP